MIVSIDAEKVLEYPFMINPLPQKTYKLGVEGTSLNIIKARYGKPTANIVLSG